MKVNKIDHTCIAVKNLDQARSFWEPVLGKPSRLLHYNGLSPECISIEKNRGLKPVDPLH